jgi:hypothetical protein
MINNKEQARPAQKQKEQTNWEKNPKNNLSKVEGILTSSIQLKQLKNKAYYLAFFQLEGLDQDIPVVFKADKSVADLEANKPDIPPRAKVLLEGH